MLQTGLLTSTIVGATVGCLAYLLVRGRPELRGDVAVGIGGALISGLLFTAIDPSSMTGFHTALFSPVIPPIATAFTAWSVIVAVLGSGVLLAATRIASGHRRLATT